MAVNALKVKCKSLSKTFADRNSIRIDDCYRWSAVTVCQHGPQNRRKVKVCLGKRIANKDKRLLLSHFTFHRLPGLCDARRVVQIASRIFRLCSAALNELEVGWRDNQSPVRR